MTKEQKALVPDMVKRVRNGEIPLCRNCKRLFKFLENRDCDVCLAIEANLRFK